MKILVTGGVRSGKSRHAEGMLTASASVTYIAPGPTQDDDPDWQARLAAHRSRRPASWTTVETHDLSAALAEAAVRSDPVLLDCWGTWLAAVIDEHGLWDADYDAVFAVVTPLVTQALAVLPEEAVMVTNEVGLGVVPEYRSGRLFRDLLGAINQQVADVCDEVHLVVAGRVLTL